MKSQHKCFVIDNSPVEFTIVGPNGGDDNVVLKSVNARLDIVGYFERNQISHKSEIVETESNSDFFEFTKEIFSLVFGNRHQINIVQSNKFKDLDKNEDDRVSSFHFIWVGKCSKFSKNQIANRFNLYLPDLIKALKAKDQYEIEKAIAPVILECKEVRERVLLMRRRMGLILKVYIIILLSVISFSVIIK